MMNYSHSYDVVIIGSGLVGLSCALGLAKHNLSIAVIEAKPPEPILDTPSLRVSAINYASQQMLINLGVWEQLEAKRISTYHSMHVWEKDGLGNIRFDGDTFGQQNIGHIVENNCLQHALRRKVEQSDAITIVSGKAVNIGFGEREAWLTLDDLSHISTRLVVAADGAESWVRQQCQIPLTSWDYGHTALVATIKTQRSHEACARQAFLESGPLAFLPLSDPHLNSIVWSTSPKMARDLVYCDTQEFNQRLTAAFDGRLGMCELVSERVTLPLKMRYSRHFARHRLVLIGDAAHTIHPLAGQGVNLGFMDSAALAQEVGRLTNAKKDIGLLSLLREFERWRKADAVKMVGVMEAFKQSYQGDHLLKKVARDIGMKIVNNIPEIKENCLLHAMGKKGDLPDICQDSDERT